MLRLRRVLFLLPLAILGANSEPTSLCKPDERVAFSCSVGKKRASLCALGDLRGDQGRLIYRFGRDASHVELEHGAAANPARASFSFDYVPMGAKGESKTVGFRRGEFRYLINHAAGAFGIDGGDNYASIRVLQGARQIAELGCHEPSAVDHLYEELSTLGLPSSDAI